MISDHGFPLINAEMWENRGADRSAKAKAKIDLSRRGLQWKTNKDCTLSWQKISSFRQTRNFKIIGMSLISC